MGLTIKEKEHWKTRIANKIQVSIDTLLANESPAYLEKVGRKAGDEARKKLGVHKLYLERIALMDRSDELLRQQAAILFNEPVESVTGDSWRLNSAAERIVDQTAMVLRPAIMESDPIGRQILRLEREKEQLLDTVWLATSSKQIRQLWEGVGEFLGEKNTKPQSIALEIEPKVNEE